VDRAGDGLRAVPNLLHAVLHRTDQPDDQGDAPARATRITFGSTIYAASASRAARRRSTYGARCPVFEQLDQFGVEPRHALRLVPAVVAAAGQQRVGQLPVVGRLERWRVNTLPTRARQNFRVFVSSGPA
jgi:hypothetical protein